MPEILPWYLPPLPQDSPHTGRVILRDGSTARIRLTTPADTPLLQQLVLRLSPVSRSHRFFSAGETALQAMQELADGSDPSRQVTLVVTRGEGEATRAIATGSYIVSGPETAEVAMMVDEEFHERGLGTLLLERLALVAVMNGIRRFRAVTQPDNRAMLEVFRHSGFQVSERLEGAEVSVDLSVLPGLESVEQSTLRDRVATVASLRPFFQPSSVAVVGASRDPQSIGHRILQALVLNRFHGPVYPVNPKAHVVSSIRAYPSVRELPEPVDLAVIAVPRDAVLPVVDDCGQAGVRALVVITAGFAETGAEGRALQEKLVEKVRAYGMRMVGPNCLGLLNTDPAVRLNASFSPVFPPAGRVAMSSQSGALGLAILAYAQELGLGLSTFVSVGNKADVSGNDLLQYWEEDPNTAIVLLYLESFGNPRRFAPIARRVARRKPIIAVKGGRSAAGRRAAGSHTAALAGSDVAVDALFQQTGVIRAETLNEMFDLAAALANQPLPPGNRVAILTNAGGPGILCADACEAAGLLIPELSDATRRQLAGLLPPTASLGNPVDMIASAGPDQYRQAIATLLADGAIDALIVIYIPVGLADLPSMTAAVEAGVAAGRSGGGRNKPVLACFMAEHGVGPLRFPAEIIPSYRFPEAAARALGGITRYARWRERPLGTVPDFPDVHPAEARRVCREALATRGGGWLTPQEVRQVLSALGLPVLGGGIAQTPGEAAGIARAIGYPVAAKLASTTILHKTEMGGVHLNLADEDAVRSAFAAIHSSLERAGRLNEMHGVLIQPMVKGAAELMMGTVEDPTFGPLIAFGLGGIHVEVLRDVVFRVTPLTDRDAAEMVREIRGYRLLEGYRGHPAADVAALENALLRLSRLVEEVPEITEIDMNPVLALEPGAGCRIVDARVRVDPLETGRVPHFTLAGGGPAQGSIPAEHPAES